MRSLNSINNILAFQRAGDWDRDLAGYSSDEAMQLLIVCRSHLPVYRGYNLGEHGNSQFVAWRSGPCQRTCYYRSLLSRRADAINYESLRGGYTVFFVQILYQFGIAAASQRLAEAVINDSHEEMPVSNYRPEYGTYLGYPAIVGRKGILERLDLHLTEERKRKIAPFSRNYQRKYWD